MPFRQHDKTGPIVSGARVRFAQALPMSIAPNHSAKRMAPVAKLPLLQHPIVRSSDGSCFETLSSWRKIEPQAGCPQRRNLCRQKRYSGLATTFPVAAFHRSAFPRERTAWCGEIQFRIPYVMREWTFQTRVGFGGQKEST